MLRKYILLMLLIISSTLFAEIRAIWLPIWNFSTPDKIDQALRDCNNNGINLIIAQVRYRGDAMYIPNKSDAKYTNNEKRSYLLKDDFDPLQYLIDKKGSIDIYAWITTFVITPHDLKKITDDHIFYVQPNWVTADFANEKMNHQSYEGAFLDPGIKEVQTYTKNVILDIVSNYRLDGIQLDYIRYPDKYFGLNRSARKIFKAETEYEDADSWLTWKENQINNFVKLINTEIKTVSPDIKLSAAVISNPAEAKERYSQDWFSWLENGYIDLVFPMAYTTSDAGLSGLYNIYPQIYHNKIVPGLRAWSEDKSYKTESINNKIALTRKQSFSGFALYSYDGIIKNEYFRNLNIRK